jgi:hypothetical protein
MRIFPNFGRIDDLLIGNSIDKCFIIHCDSIDLKLTAADEYFRNG